MLKFIPTSPSLYSDDAYQTSFSGFLYEPLNGRKVARSFHQTSSTNGAYNPSPFNEVSVNIGNGWYTANYTFITSYAGIYRLHLTATSMIFSQMDCRLMWNGAAYANIYSTTINYYKAITRLRAIMVKAKLGDAFHIATTCTTQLYSSDKGLISFTGFLISS